jgi:hypothetical protein
MEEIVFYIRELDIASRNSSTRMIQTDSYSALSSLLCPGNLKENPSS